MTITEAQLREKRHKHQMALKSWRAKSPLRKWRERIGIDINTAAFELGLSFSTYQKWDYGNGHPVVREEDGKLKATVNVREKVGGPSEPKDWDDHMLSRTGVSLSKFMLWFNQRPRT